MTHRAPHGWLSRARQAGASPCPFREGVRPAALGRAVLIGALALGVQVPAALAQEPRREQDLSELEGRPAPALEVTGWLNTDGPLTWEDLRGKVVLVDFWGTW
jgi:hypothetical protein